MGLYLFDICLAAMPLISLYFIMFHVMSFLFLVQCRFKQYRKLLLVFEGLCMPIGYQTTNTLINSSTENQKYL
jgi:hypothetical protein